LTVFERVEHFADNFAGIECSRESFSAGGRSPPWASISQGEFRFLMNTVSFDAECTGTFDIRPIQVVGYLGLSLSFVNWIKGA
jgi:hypothetical protein